MKMLHEGNVTYISNLCSVKFLDQKKNRCRILWLLHLTDGRGNPRSAFIFLGAGELYIWTQGQRISFISEVGLVRGYSSKVRRAASQRSLVLHSSETSFSASLHDAGHCTGHKPSRYECSFFETGLSSARSVTSAADVCWKKHWCSPQRHMSWA